MCQWLTRLIWHDDFLGDIIPGHKDRMTRLVEQHEEEKKQRHEKEVRARLERERFEREREVRDPYWARRESERKRQLLELQLKDAEWILAHEKRLAELPNKTTRQRSRAKQLGADTERLRKLEHHLAGLRSSLD